MKKPYQIHKERAAKRFQEWTAVNELPIQLTFPTAEIAELAQSSLGGKCQDSGPGSTRGAGIVIRPL